MILKKLDIFIAKKFLVTLVFILAMASVISVIFDISEKTEDFIRNHLSTATIFNEYYIYFIPNLLNLISPLLIFISALYFTSRMANQSEIVAILSGGVSYFRFLRPYIIVAVGLCFLDMGLKNFVIPNTYYHVNNFDEKYFIKGYFFNKRNIHRQIDNTTFFYIENFDVNTNFGLKFTIEKIKDGVLINKLIADEAYYDTVKASWKLSYIIDKKYIGKNEIIDRKDSMRIKIPITNKEFGQKIRSTPAMTTPDLISFIQSERFRGESQINFYLIDLYKRFALPIANIILVLMAVSIASRKIRGGMGAHLLLGILLAALFEMSMRFSTTFSTNGSLNPLISVFAPLIIYGILTAYLIWKTPK